MPDAFTEHWREWARRPVPPDAREAYDKWRQDHYLGTDPDPDSILARYWWLGWEARGEDDGL